MLGQWLLLFFMLLVILLASQLFTNALEHLAQRLKLSTGITGSILAAVATALPETSIPIIAIVAGTSDQALNEEISVGAILGAPLMLATLSTFLLALSTCKQRGLGGRIKPELSGFTRDINFFLGAFFLAALALFIPPHPLILRLGMSLILIALYLFYLGLTMRASKRLVMDGHGVVAHDPLLMSRVGFKPGDLAIALQLMLGLVLLFCGAKGFINGIGVISHTLQISALVLSLLIIPIATELPEKVNSILWLRKYQDTLGVSNITGAMVFQGTLLPALGILLTPWQPSKAVLMGILITLAAVVWLRLNAAHQGLRIKALLVNGGLYGLYLWLVFNG